MLYSFKRPLARLVLAGFAISLLSGCLPNRITTYSLQERRFVEKKYKSGTRNGANAVVYSIAGVACSIVAMPFVMGIAMITLVAPATITVASVATFIGAIVAPGVIFVGLGNYFLNKAGENIVGEYEKVHKPLSEPEYREEANL